MEPLVMCKFCRSQISNKAKICPNCGKQQKIAIVKVLITSFLVLIGMYWFCPGLYDPYTDNRTPADRENAVQRTLAIERVTIAQQEVKERLISPATAKFPWGTDAYRISTRGDTVTIAGYVDAQNAFGATIRNNFTVVVVFVDGGGTGRYRVIDVDIR